jgi:Protein of unknown function (DUF4236)
MPFATLRNMSLRFRKSVKLFPGVKINLGKTGIGMSTGLKGAHIGVNKRGTYTNVGIPGTGISSFQYLGKKRHLTNKQPQASPQAQQANNHLFLKIVSFPVWFPFLFAFILFKLLFKVAVNSMSTRQKSASSNVTQNKEMPQEQTLKLCTGQVLAKESPEQLEKHYELMLRENMRNYNDYLKSEIIKGKKWDAYNSGKLDPNACEVCVENAKVGSIPLEATFPSGHMYPPAGSSCRCTLLGVTDENA